MFEKQAKEFLKDFEKNVFCFEENIDYFIDNDGIKEAEKFYFEKHIENCHTCNYIYKEQLRELSDDNKELVNKKFDSKHLDKNIKEPKSIEIAKVKTSEIKKDQIWMVDGFPFPSLDNLGEYNYSLISRKVYIYSVSDDKVLAFPLNEDHIIFTAEKDIIVQEGVGPIKKMYAIEVWNPIEIKKTQLYGYLGNVKNEITNAVNALFNGQEFSNGENKLFFSGTKIEEDSDIRIEYQKIEKKAVKFMNEELRIERLLFELRVFEVALIRVILLFSSKNRIVQKFGGVPEKFIYEGTFEIFNKKYEMVISANDNAEKYTLSFDCKNSNTGEKCNNFEIGIIELDEQGNFTEDKSKDLYKKALLSGRKIKRLKFYNKEYSIKIRKECNIALTIKDINNEKNDAPELIFLNIEK